MQKNEKYFRKLNNNLVQTKVRHSLKQISVNLQRLTIVLRIHSLTLFIYFSVASYLKFSRVSQPQGLKRGK